MVGNSSSGLTEAPSFKLAVVNIGERQTGRIRGENIIDVPNCRKAVVKAAIEKALSDGFSISMERIKNPYGGKNISEKIIKKLKIIPIGEHCVKKKFYDLLHD